ncbi:MAG: hypothetical protein KDD89_03270, partial [Anaerolineales bacterium]|nr:hypothetical protein [Anaerolineales bacterium]
MSTQGTTTTQKLTTAVVAVFVLIILSLLVWRVYAGDSRLLRNATVGNERITPNADGDSDITKIAYEITRNATVSIYLENEDGQRYYFRQNQPRGNGQYEVYFSGVVDGYTLPDEQIQGEILARLLPDGRYTWTITATDETGTTETASGPLEIAEADTALPELRDFGLDKAVFTPNRDGINDRVLIQYDLQKEADVRVFLEMPDGVARPIAETERAIPAGDPGRHYYDYEGGVDAGELPPEDGVYTIVALASDEEGQRIRVEESLEIALGGVPRADIFAPPAGDTFEVSATAVAICDTLYFTLTVENYGMTPIRTTGPAPGTVYDSEWNYNTLGWFTESGAWRVAVGYENELANYPYRWALGSAEELVEIDGHQYLMPGDRATITGGIRLTGPFGERNPQPVWAGLIHEDVEISQFNNRVDPKAILVDMPD